MKFPHFGTACLFSLLASLTLSGGPSAPVEPTNAEEAAAEKAAAAAVVAENYNAWVATLTPPHQAWEKRAAGKPSGASISLFIKRRKVEGRANAWDYVVDDPALPRVLLIGDSVSRGYTMAVRRALAGRVNVHRAPANLRSGEDGSGETRCLAGRRERGIVIHFNFGIHDRATPLPDYETRLREIADRLAATGAKLVWATTTPVPDTSDGKYSGAPVVERNKVAAKVMAEKGVVVNDLFAAMAPRLAAFQNPEDVHFTAAGYDFLGEKVAAVIAAELK